VRATSALGHVLLQGAAVGLDVDAGQLAQGQELARRQVLDQQHVQATGAGGRG